MPQPPGYPGLYVQEVPSLGSSTFAGVGTSVTAFVGHISHGLPDQPVKIHSFAEFSREFGGLDRDSPVSYAIHQFFLNGGGRAIVVRAGSDGSRGIRDDLIGTTSTTGMNALVAEEFNLLCIPETFDLPDADAAAVAEAAIALCESRRAFYLVDPPKGRSVSNIVAWADGLTQSKNAAIYFPAVQLTDPLDNRLQLAIAASGTVAGVYARTDTHRGVWRAPAGLDANLAGVTGLAIPISNAENDAINSGRINALRHFPGRGHVVWGARTLAGGDSQAAEYRYVPVRRLALYIMECIHRGTQWTVFEINEESTWSKVRRDVNAFMHGLFLDGALQGNSAKHAYYVHCGADTTTQSDIDDGWMNIGVGFAPAKPGEFLVIRVQRRLGEVTAQEAPMPQPIVNAERLDPYRSFKFRISWDGRCVAGASEMSGFDRKTITLERGITHDPEFERWTHGVEAFDADPGREFSLEAIRRDVVVEVCDESGVPALAYRIRRCWVSDYQSMPDLDANANVVAIQQLTLQNGGWERDDSDLAPSDPSG